MQESNTCYVLGMSSEVVGDVGAVAAGRWEDPAVAASPSLDSEGKSNFILFINHGSPYIALLQLRILKAYRLNSWNVLLDSGDIIYSYKIAILVLPQLVIFVN